MNFRLMFPSDLMRIVAHLQGLPLSRTVRNEKTGEDEEEQINYRVAIEEIKPRRSEEQNRRYWALLTAISQQAPAHMLGQTYDSDTWHYYCRKRFLGMEPGPMGEGVPRSTKKLKVQEFSDYMTQCEQWAHEELPGFDFEYREAA